MGIRLKISRRGHADRAWKQTTDESFWQDLQSTYRGGIFLNISFKKRLFDITEALYAALLTTSSSKP
jgi:hypothetical protein